MKKFYTFCLLLVSVALLAQEAGKAGELLKNEVKDNEKQTLEKSLLQSKNENASERNPVQNGRRNLNNNDYYNLGRAYYYSGGKIQNDAISIKDAKQRQKKIAEALPFFEKSDSAFIKLTELNPN